MSEAPFVFTLVVNLAHVVASVGNPTSAREVAFCNEAKRAGVSAGERVLKARDVLDEITMLGSCSSQIKFAVASFAGRVVSNQFFF